MFSRSKTLDVEKLKAKENAGGLIKGLSPKYDLETRRRAAEALRTLKLGDARIFAALRKVNADENTPEELGRLVRVSLNMRGFVEHVIAYGGYGKCETPMSDIHAIYYALALRLRKRFDGSSSAAIRHINLHLSGKCMTCGTLYSGERLTDVGVMQDMSSSLFIIGGTGGGLAQGKCDNPDCSGTVILLDWRYG